MKSHRSTSAFKSALKEAIAIRDGMFCDVCRAAIFQLSDDINIDHSAPLSKGGKTVFENLRITHNKCNNKKADKIMGEV